MQQNNINYCKGGEVNAIFEKFTQNWTEIDQNLHFDLFDIQLANPRAVHI